MEAWRSGFSKGCWSTAVPLLTPSGLLMEAITRDIASLARTPLGHRPGWRQDFGKRQAEGGPLSPLLANVFLDEVDQELEKRGVAFVRYADDLNVYVGSKRAGEDLMETLKRHWPCQAPL